MAKHKGLVVLFLVVAFLALESFLIWPKAIFVAFGLINVALVLIIRYLVKKNPTAGGWGNFIILPVIFTSGIIAYTGLIPESVFANKLLVQFLFLVALYFLFHYLGELIKSLSQPEIPNDLINFSSGFSFLALFFSVSAILGLQLFLNLSYWILLLVIILLIAGLTYQFLWLNRLQPKDNRLLTIINVLVLAQITWVLYFLPFDYNILGLLLVLAFYLLINTLKFYLGGNLNRRHLKPLFIFVFIILLLIFLTVKWR
jgi:hypothetical protein